MEVSKETRGKVDAKLSKLAGLRTRARTGTLMMAGVVFGIIAWFTIESDAESVMHQVYGVATGLFLIVGCYVVARGLDNWHEYYANRTSEEAEEDRGATKE